MRGFGQDRYGRLLQYLNSVISDESLDQEFRMRAACRLADTLADDDQRDARHELARERAAARKIEASCRVAEAANRSRELTLQERDRYTEPVEAPDPATTKLFADLLRPKENHDSDE